METEGADDQVPYGLGLRGHRRDSGTACFRLQRDMVAPSGNRLFIDLSLTKTRNNLFGLSIQPRELGELSRGECLASGLWEGVQPRVIFIGTLKEMGIAMQLPPDKAGVKIEGVEKNLLTAIFRKRLCSHPSELESFPCSHTPRAGSSFSSHLRHLRSCLAMLVGDDGMGAGGQPARWCWEGGPAKQRDGPAKQRYSPASKNQPRLQGCGVMSSLSCSSIK